MKRLQRLQLIISLLIAVPILGAERFVSTTGSDSNTCAQSTSSSMPKRNFNGASGALACMSAGDTLTARGGTYFESISTRTGSALPAGTTGAPTIVRAFNGEIVWLQPPMGSDNNYFELNWVKFDGINVDNTSITPGNPTTNPSSDGWKFFGDNVTITNSIIKNAAIGILGGGDHFTATNLEIFGMKDSVAPNNGLTGYGIYTCSTNSLFDHIYFHDNASRGMQQYTQGVTPCSGNTWSNNLFINSGQGMDLCCDPAASVFNNVFSGSGGITFRSDQNALVANNTFYNASVGLDWANGGCSNCTIRNNIFYMVTLPVNSFGVNITGTCDHNLGTTGGGCTGSTGTDPLFVNAGNGNFRLTSTSSPAYNTGTAVGAVTADRDGVPRPQAGTYDIGAYELTNTPAGQPPIEDFVYTTGTTLTGQCGGQFWTTCWAGPTSFIADVGPAGFPNGGNAARCPGTIGCDNTRNFTDITTGPVSAYVYTTDCNATASAFGTTMGFGLNSVMYVQAQGGQFRIYDNAIAGFRDLVACTPNTVHRIDIDFDASHPNQYRARIDNGSYSSYYTVLGGSYSTISYIEIFNLSTSTNVFYLDAIGIDVLVASRVKFTAQPATSVLQGQTLGTVQVSVMDSTGNSVITTSSASVTLSKNAGCPGGMALNGSLTMAAVSGVATFSNINLDSATGTCSLDAASSGLTGDTSSSITVNMATPVSSRPRLRIRTR